MLTSIHNQIRAFKNHSKEKKNYIILIVCVEMEFIVEDP